MNKRINKTFSRKNVKKNKNVKRNKTKRTRSLSRKMRGGYTTVDKGTWTEITFTPEEEQQIIDYVMKDEKTKHLLNEDGTFKEGREIRETKLLNTEIRDALFPNIPAKAKNNADHNIRVLLGRGGA